MAQRLYDSRPLLLRQVGHAAYMLTQVGLHESAASLLTAFDMPLSTVIRSLAAVRAPLQW